MPVLGKEVEHQLTPDQIANREVEGYIEQVERHAETQQPKVQTQNQTPVQSKPVPSDMGKTVTGQFSNLAKPKIVLPLDQNEVETGLKRNVFEGVRWLSEWCVMMIKKYPGRVFYMPPETNR
jgi:hypothetical protein